MPKPLPSHYGLLYSDTRRVTQAEVALTISDAQREADYAAERVTEAQRRGDVAAAGDWEGRLAYWSDMWAAMADEVMAARAATGPRTTLATL